MSTGFTPRTLDDARRILADHPDAKPMAGGTDLMVAPPAIRATWTTLLDLTRIPDFHGITRSQAGWRIGACTPFTEIAAHPDIAQRFPILVQAAQVIGGWQIQNRATLGGNMANASPAGDSLPVLLALQAQVGIVGAQGDREVQYDQFHTGYRTTALAGGELIGWITLPEPPANAVQRYRKVGTRAAQAISKLVIALAAERHDDSLRNVRIAAGSVAATPVRLKLAEAAAAEGPVTPELATRAGHAASGEVRPIDDVRSTADYRKEVLARVVRRLVLATVN